MLQNAVAQYKKVRATTSNQGDLLLALYDGLFRFLNASKLCLERSEFTRAREMNSKAYAIISELNLALDPRVHPELCQNLGALYIYCMDRLRASSRNDDAAALDDVIVVLSPLREAWRLAVPKAVAEGVKFQPTGK